MARAPQSGGENAAPATASTDIPATDQPLEDAAAPEDAVSVAPARTEQALVDQLQLRWDELKHFVGGLAGEVDGELSDVLEFVRSKL